MLKAIKYLGLTTTVAVAAGSFLAAAPASAAVNSAPKVDVVKQDWNAIRPLKPNWNAIRPLKPNWNAIRPLKPNWNAIRPLIVS